MRRAHPYLRPICWLVGHPSTWLGWPPGAHVTTCLRCGLVRATTDREDAPES